MENAHSASGKVPNSGLEMWIRKKNPVINPTTYYPMILSHLLTHKKENLKYFLQAILEDIDNLKR